MSKDYIMQLEATIENLRRDNALLKEMKNEQEKVLEILKPYLRLAGVFLLAKMPLVDDDHWVIIKEIEDEEELELLKKILGQTQI